MTTRTLPQSDEPASITERTICLNLNFSVLGTHRKLGADQIEVDADKTLVQASKTILESPELENVRKKDRAFKAWIASLALPSFFRDGIWLVPIGLVEHINERAEEYQTERETKLVPAFMDAYEGARDAAREGLRGIYDPADYPSAARVLSMFKFTWAWVTFSTPTTLKKISKAMFEKEAKKAAAHVESLKGQIEELLLLEMKQLVDHMVERLQPGKDGKPKVFRNTLTKNLSDFLGTVNFRNVVDSEEISALSEQARQLLNGVDAEELRKSEDIRVETAKGFEALKAQLDELTVEKPKRMITLKGDA